MFDFTEAMERLVRHITGNCPQFAHIWLDQIIISYIRTRSPGAHGVYASVQPLRAEHGSDTLTRRGRVYSMPQVQVDGKEILYIVYFALPRFMDLDFETKLTTVFHELYHISPQFNGDIRRFKGKNYAHGHSRKRYNERLESFVKTYMSKPEAEEETAFLRMSFSELEKAYGGVVGTKVRPPRPRPV